MKTLSKMFVGALTGVQVLFTWAALWCAADYGVYSFDEFDDMIIFIVLFAGIGAVDVLAAHLVHWAIKN